MLKLAFRNLFRSRRRTITTLVTVTLSAMLVCVLRFMGYGMHQHMVWSIAGISSGYVQVAANGWLEKRDPGRALDVSPELLKSLKIPGVTHVTPRIQGYALASHKKDSRFISVVAVQAETEQKIVTLHERIVRGRFLQSAGAPGEIQHEAILGVTLAERLGATTGSELALVSSQFDGSVGAILVRVVGIYKTQAAELDGGHIFVNLESGRTLFAPDSPEQGIIRYTSLLLGVTNIRDARKVYGALSEIYPPPVMPEGVAREESENYKPVVHDWEALNPALVQITVLDQIGNEIFIGILILVMAFGVLSNVQASIQERAREIGIMSALGTRNRTLVLTLFYESLLTLLPGLFLGSLIGAGIAYYFQINPIIITGEYGQAFTDFGFEPKITAVVDPGELWVGILSLLLPSLLFTLIATRRILKLDPARIISSF